LSDQNVLEQIATNDRSRSIREDAVKRLIYITTSQTVLFRIAIEHEDKSVREMALKKLTDQALIAKVGTEREANLVNYVSDCVGYSPLDEEETRNAFAMDDIKVAQYLGAGQQTFNGIDLLALAEKAIEKYPTLDMPYYWLSHYLGYHRHEYIQAMALLDRGLSVCRKKSSLCVEYGTIELENGRIKRAVMWWIRACILQSRSKRDNYLPFLELSVTCGLLGQGSEALCLKQISKQLRSEVDISSDGCERRRKLLFSSDEAAIKAAISEFIKQYAPEISRGV
jgi:hypothetical protein